MPPCSGGAGRTSRYCARQRPFIFDFEDSFREPLKDRGHHFGKGSAAAGFPATMLAYRYARAFK